jgi:Kef-type K+ transport system membrane component KefB
MALWALVYTWDWVTLAGLFVLPVLGAVFSPFYAFPFALCVGIPAHFVLCRLGIRSCPAYILFGGILGAPYVPGFALRSWYPGHVHAAELMQSLSGFAFVCGIGVVGGSVGLAAFWYLARPDISKAT